MSIERRAEIHAALGDPTRLTVVDELLVADRSPGELAAFLDLSPTLLAFHLDVLERAGLVERIVSSGDRRRRYVRARPATLGLVRHVPRRRPRHVVFVCTRNSARSQIAAAVWRDTTGPASSAGTDPADEIAPGAIAAARRSGLDLGDARPQLLTRRHLEHQVITVCDRAHEQLDRRIDSWHWSIPDPVESGADADFDLAVAMIRARVAALGPPPSPAEEHE